MAKKNYGSLHYSALFFEKLLSKKIKNNQDAIKSFKIGIYLFKELDKLQTNFELLSTRNITFRRFNSLIKSVSKLTDIETSLDLFEIDDERRTEIRLKANDGEERYEETDVDYYQVYSKITNIANNYKSNTRKKLQTLAGKILINEEIK